MSRETTGTDTSSPSSSSSQNVVSPVPDPVVLTPTPTPPPEPAHRNSNKHMSSLRSDITAHDTTQKMDDKSAEQPAASTDRQEPEEVSVTKPEEKITAETNTGTAAPKKKTNKCQKSSHKKKSKALRARDKRRVKDESSDSDSSSDSDTDSDADSSDDSSSEEEIPKKKKKSAVKSKRAKKSKDKKRRKGKKQVSEDEESDSESESDGESSAEEAPRKKKSSKKAKANASESEAEPSQDDDDEEIASLKAQLKDLMAQRAEKKTAKSSNAKRRRSTASKSSKSKPKPAKKGSDALDYKRVDQLWDGETHQFQLKESAEEDDKEFAEFAFLVRRRFDWENKYLSTVVDIKSKQLRAVLQEVMKGCKSVSLEAMEPCIDPNLLFLYLEDLRTFYKKTLKTRIRAEKKRKAAKKLEVQRSLARTLVKYLDEDYADTKKTLLPLLAAGNITFDLLWALFTPNDVAITSCYGSWDNPRCFKIDYAHKYQTLSRGEFYCIEGRYLEYDGKSFGYGNYESEIDKFQGPRKITSLGCYPLRYHKDVDGVRRSIIQRGEKFVSMEGMQYKFHKGLAFMKKKKQVLRININGRVMIDPATFRRVNPNYPISTIRPKDDDLIDESVAGDCSCCDSDAEDNEDAVAAEEPLQSAADDRDDGDDAAPEPKFRYKWVENADGEQDYVAVEVDADGVPIQTESLDRLDGARSYTEEQLLLTSPVVVGFAFSEKLWLEFTLSGVHDVSYNDEAFDALVLPSDQKSTVRALVESHKFHAAKAIDDVVVGKGQGCVIVLHGKPGVGKTLTAEAISELTRSPLYTISAGELGTDPARLESELEKILSIAHSWGAVLLLDEADVFLEKREVQDVHRNALVSVFLRQLEYCQNLLVLTTNRVETFDEAFHSRIHLALRYGELTPKAKKAIWTTFLDKVRGVEGGVKVAEFSEADLDALARHTLNGRQIKNVVKTAQALALHEKTALTLGHIKRVLDVAETFDRDLRGGTGYIDAMRSYT